MISSDTKTKRPCDLAITTKVLSTDVKVSQNTELPSRIMATMDKGILRTQVNSVSFLRSPTADRNKEPILNTLKSLLLPRDQENTRALELASGTGQHVAYFAQNIPHVTWQPSDCDAKSLSSITGYIEVTKLPNLLSPVSIDATHPPAKWADSSLTPSTYDLLLCVNMIHISEWAATEGLFKGGGVYLKEGGILATYGPYKIHGSITPDSNVQFDCMLRQQCSDWGLRDVDDLEKLAKENSMILKDMIDLPANNKMLVFEKI